MPLGGMNEAFSVLNMAPMTAQRGLVLAVTLNISRRGAGNMQRGALIPYNQIYSIPTLLQTRIVLRSPESST